MTSQDEKDFSVYNLEEGKYAPGCRGSNLVERSREVLRHKAGKTS
jgi:hypothetical protein